MKIREGFVSNSSSSSFMIYGLYFDKDDIDCLNDIEGFEEDNIYEFFEEKDLECHGEDGYYWVGTSLAACKDDQTMGNFKEEVKKKLKTVLGEELPDNRFDVFSEVIYG